MREWLAWGIPGVVFGIVAALGASRPVQPLLYDIPSRDAATYFGVVALAMMLSLAAAYVPARRITRISIRDVVD